MSYLLIYLGIGLLIYGGFLLKVQKEEGLNGILPGEYLMVLGVFAIIWPLIISHWIMWWLIVNVDLDP